MIYHVHSDYTPQNPETIRRMRLARQTWSMQPWVDLPISEKSGRLFRDRAGAVPYIKDILNAAASGKQNQDIIVFTNSDICVSPDCCFKIAAAFQSINAGYCFRRDFGRLDAPLPATAIKKGCHYVGSDLYAFRAGWWRRYGPEFPDMLLGRECWDAVLRLLIDDTHPKQNPTLCDLIYHEKHASTWEKPNNKRILASQLHNVNLARQWMLASGLNPQTIGI